MRNAGSLAAFACLVLIGCSSDDRHVTPVAGDDNVYSLGIQRSLWRHASTPAAIDTAASARARISWYNPDYQVLIAEIWDGSAGQGTTNILIVRFRSVDFKRVRDTVNMVIDTVSHPIQPERSWNGFMRNIPLAATVNLARSDTLELRLRGDEGIMHIDLGRISEDINGDGMLNKEDLDGFEILDPEEDVGLDGLPDPLEFGYDPVLNPDPSGDDYDPEDVWKINGTEGNGLDPDGGYIPDTEDPDRDGLETANNYFSYRIDLSDTTRFYVPGSRNQYGWKTLRVPIADSAAVDAVAGTPSRENIWYVRIWFDSASAAHLNTPITVEIASMTLNTPPPADTVADSTQVFRVIRDIVYDRRRMYDLGRLMWDRARSDTLPEPEKYDFDFGDSIISALLYIDNVDDPPSIRLTRTPGICYVDPQDTVSDDPLLQYRTGGLFEPIAAEDRYIDPDNFYVQFLRSAVSARTVVGVYLEVERAGGLVDTIGDISGDTLRLKLIKPRSYAGINHHVWEYEWRNVYRLGLTDLDLSRVHITIRNGTPPGPNNVNPNDLTEQDGISYLRILGLDRGDDYGLSIPDGEIDRFITIDPVLGLLYFPCRHPFDGAISFVRDSDSNQVFLCDSVPEIYLSTDSLEVAGASKYYIAVEYAPPL